MKVPPQGRALDVLITDRFDGIAIDFLGVIYCSLGCSARDWIYDSAIWGIYPICKTGKAAEIASCFTARRRALKTEIVVEPDEKVLTEIEMPIDAIRSSVYSSARPSCRRSKRRRVPTLHLEVVASEPSVASSYPRFWKAVS
jgi:hypothetical protein